MFKQEWHYELSQKSSCTLYRSFKLNLELEKYFTLPNCSDKINICKLRCRNTKIPVVILGYRNRYQPYEERMCSMCNRNEIGDEYHYILQCPIFQSHRRKFINNYYVRNPSMNKFSQLLQSENIRIQTNLAKLIKEIRKIFS